MIFGISYDAKGKKYNIEVQRADKGGSVKRARYNRCKYFDSRR